MAMANDTYSHQARAQGLGHAELFEGGFEHYHHALEHIAAVTPQRVRDLARSVFAPENALSLDVTPQHTRWWMWALGLFLRMRSR
jgi:predicted Zn-dependent peptidase